MCLSTNYIVFDPVYRGMFQNFKQKTRLTSYKFRNKLRVYADVASRGERKAGLIWPLLRMPQVYSNDKVGWTAHSFGRWQEENIAGTELNTIEMCKENVWLEF